MKERQIKFTKSFENTGDDWSGYSAAIKFLEKHGFSYGSMQREDPIGLVKGDVLISKWRNLDKKDIKALDGMIRFKDGSPRNGIAIIDLYIDLKE